MESVRGEIEEIVNRETRAWDTQDVDLLMRVGLRIDGLVTD